MKHEVNVMGKQCPIPVVMTKKVIDNAAVGDEIEILIDNETAVNNPVSYTHLCMEFSSALHRNTSMKLILHMTIRSSPPIPEMKC